MARVSIKKRKKLLGETAIQGIVTSVFGEMLIEFLSLTAQLLRNLLVHTLKQIMVVTELLLLRLIEGSQHTLPSILLPLLLFLIRPPSTFGNVALEAGNGMVLISPGLDFFGGSEGAM